MNYIIAVIISIVMLLSPGVNHTVSPDIVETKDGYMIVVETQDGSYYEMFYDCDING